MNEEMAQLHYRLDVARQLLTDVHLIEEERSRMAAIVLGQPEELLGRLRKEDPTNIWSTEEFKRDFEAISFLAPMVMVWRKKDRQKGMLMFTHLPRWYFGWMPVQR